MQKVRRHTQMAALAVSAVALGLAVGLVVGLNSAGAIADSHIRAAGIPRGYAQVDARTDWRQIAALYNELLRFDSSPVIEANRAVAVAYAEGPAAGLAILDTLAASSRLVRWPQLHIARGALLALCGRHQDAIAAYSDALALEPAGAIQRHISGQIAALGAAHEPSEET
jgi:RNA polymerase sigma-70 factor (ECF subfamily)